jgi:NhaA family Na+:H+ antiporter
MRRRTAPWWLIVPIMLAAWVCVHASGVHATVTGIALGLLTPVRTIAAEHESPAERLEHRLHPWSAAVVVPIFALSAAGIPLAAAGEALSDPVAHGIVAGLLVGKVVGVMGGAWLAVRLRLGNFPENVSWGDVLPVAMLAGVGYTVSLLIARLSLSEAAADRASAAVLAASVAASLIAVVLLRLRTRVYVDGPE